MNSKIPIVPLVSIVTVNYNQAEVTICLLASLQKITYKNIEVWIVDNGSKNNDAQMIRSAQPWAYVLETGKNLGFAGGNNYALPYLKGSFILFLNNDIEVSPGFIEPLVQSMQLDNIGMASPKIMFFYQPGTIQYAGSTKLSYITMRNRHIGFAEKDNGQYDTPGYTHFVHGAAMMVSAKLIRQIGAMFEGYFLYYEELDWCERAKKAGIKIWYQPGSVVFHKESVSTGKQSVLKTYYHNRNRLLFLRRNAKGLVFMAGLFYYLAIAFPKRLVYFTLHYKPDHIKALVRSVLWHINPAKYEYIV